VSGAILRDAYTWNEVFKGAAEGIPSGNISLDLSACWGVSTYGLSLSGADAQRFVSLTLPASMKEFGVTTNDILGALPNLLEISLPGVTRIGDGSPDGNGAFSGHTGLTTINLPVVTSIGNSAFRNCTGLTTINLPVVTGIGSYAFQNCTGLTTVDLPVAAGIGNNAFQNCTGLTTVDLPVAAGIGSYAFQNCTGLTTVNLPVADGIGSYAFQNCTGLTGISLPAAPPSRGSSMFYNPGGGTSTEIVIHVPSSATAAYTTAGWIDANAGTNTALYGTNHNKITIVGDL
jgi:hypothetical protein